MNAAWDADRGIRSKTRENLQLDCANEPWVVAPDEKRLNKRLKGNAAFLLRHQRRDRDERHVLEVVEDVVGANEYEERQRGCGWNE